MSVSRKVPASSSALSSRIARKVAKIASAATTSVREFGWWRSERGRDNLRRIHSLRNRYHGRRAFVFGGGPSLRRTDVRLLRHEITIASNGIFLLFDEMGYQPTFLTVEDRLVAEDRRTELGSVRGTTKIFPRDVSDILPHDEDTIFLKFLRHYEGFPKFSGDLAEHAYWGGTVSALNLQLAYYLGCNPIVLIGFDHEYKVPPTNGQVVITSTVEDSNHFHPNYFGPGYRWHDPRLDRMEAAYLAANAFCAERGVKILNATVGGRLEVFPRVSFVDLMERGEIREG